MIASAVETFFPLDQAITSQACASTSGAFYVGCYGNLLDRQGPGGGSCDIGELCSPLLPGFLVLFTS